MSGALQEPELIPDEDEDPVAELFRTTKGDIVLHHPICATSADKHAPCDCVPVTLVRGAKA